MDSKLDETEKKKCLAKALGMLPSLEKALCVLGYICSGYSQSQELLLQKGFISILHELEELPAQEDVYHIGGAAESVLDRILDSEAAKKAVVDIRESSKQKRVHDALQKQKEMREKLLSQQKSVWGLIDESMGDDDEDDDDACHCQICYDGYKKLPGEVIGIYLKTYPCPTDPRALLTLKSESEISAMNLRDLPSELCKGISRDASCSALFNSAMVFIHFSCHRNATKAERTKAKPLSEWEAAVRRNLGNPCDTMFPLRGPAMDDSSFSSHLSSFLSTVRSSRGRINISSPSDAANVFISAIFFNLIRAAYVGKVRFEPRFLLCYERGVTDSLPANTQLTLTSKASCLSIMPWLVDAALEMNSSSLESRLENSSKEHPLMVAALCIAVCPKKQWEVMFPELVRRVIQQSCIEYGSLAHINRSDLREVSLEDRFGACFGGLSALLIADRLIQAFRKGSDSVSDMRKRFVSDSKSVTKEIDEISSELDDLKECESFQEVFDILGILEQVLSSSRDENTFVNNIWNDAASGKSDS